VGNSRIKFGLFESARCSSRALELPACLRLLAVPVAEEVPWADIHAWPELADAGGVRSVIAGANPQGIARVCDTWPADWPEPHVISDPTSLPLRSRLAYPRRVGIDRVLNAVAVNVVRPHGAAAIVVDVGTATTVDRIAEDGAFEGGAILPGFELGARSLHYYTALLPLISMDELARQPHEPLGRETRAAVRSGLFWGQLGAVKELVARLGGSGGGGNTLLLLTGGGAAILAPHLPEARFERFLSLQGLALAGDVSV
jgi:type III pantothenate kinase